MRIADPNPVYCSACFAQQPAKIHIDFEVAWDGPVINEDGLRVPIDDLYLCEDCLGLAYRQLELEQKKVQPNGVRKTLFRRENAR